MGASQKAPHASVWRRRAEERVSLCWANIHSWFSCDGICCSSVNLWNISEPLPTSPITQLKLNNVFICDNIFLCYNCIDWVPFFLINFLDIFIFVLFFIISFYDIFILVLVVELLLESRFIDYLYRVKFVTHLKFYLIISGKTLA